MPGEEPVFTKIDVSNAKGFIKLRILYEKQTPAQGNAEPEDAENKVQWDQDGSGCDLKIYMSTKN